MENNQRKSVIVHSSEAKRKAVLIDMRTERGNEINAVLQNTEIVLHHVISTLVTLRTVHSEYKNIQEIFDEYYAIRSSKRFEDTPYIDKLRSVQRLIEVQDQVHLLTAYLNEFCEKMCGVGPVYSSFVQEIKDQRTVLKNQLRLADAAESLEDLERVTIPEFTLSRPIPETETQELLKEWNKMQVHKRMSYFLQTVQDMCPRDYEEDVKSI